MATGNFTIPIKPPIPNTWDTAWTKPADWIDISTVGDNEINLLVTDGTGIAFSVNVFNSGTYSIDWGDGTVETSRASATIYSHQYTYGSGTASSYGSLYKIRIYEASGNITRWRVERHTYTNNVQYHPILWTVFGTTGLTTMVSAFYNSTAPQVYCYQLQKVTLPSTLSSCTNYSSAFQNCISLQNIDMPTAWGSVTDLSYMFDTCYSLKTVILPSNWSSSTTTLYQMFIYCYSLSNITLPSTWGTSITTISRLFYGCYSLSNITLPSTWGSVMTQASALFYACTALKYINLPNTWGSITNPAYMFSGCTGLTKINLPISWGSVNDVQYMFDGCTSLLEIDLPDSWGSITNVTRMLRSCPSLTKLTLPTTWGIVNSVYGFLSYNTGISKLTLPTSWGLVTDISSFFHQMNALTEVNLPDSWGNIGAITGAFTNCYQLENVTLPATQSNNINWCGGVFGGCYSLKNVVNLDKMGSSTLQTEMGTAFQDCEFYSSTVSISARLASFGMYGTTTNVLDVTSIRFTNGTYSLFNTSYYPTTYPYHVNVSYTGLDATALNTLFGDLPSGLTPSKTINITGCTGSATCDKTIATLKGWTVTG